MDSTIPIRVTLFPSEPKGMIVCEETTFVLGNIADLKKNKLCINYSVISTFNKYLYPFIGEGP